MRLVTRCSPSRQRPRYSRIVDPYRTTPELDVDPDPELDRLPIRIRHLGLRAARIVVTRRTLRLEPRFRRAPRSTPIEHGLAGLHLSKWLDPESAGADSFPMPGPAATIASWEEIIASPPYQAPLSATPQDARVIKAVWSRYLCSDGEFANNPAFVAVLDDDRLVAIREDPPTFDACFATAPKWPDSSARLLARALVWLSTTELARAVARVRARRERLTRVFTRAEVRARAIYGRFHHLGPEYDGVVLVPTRPELAALERWLAET
jgi:hypothetical protein